MTDQVLVEMADELRSVLLRKGLDPKDPPGGSMPAERAWGEYQRRGGAEYTDPQKFVTDLVEQVGQ